MLKILRQDGIEVLLNTRTEQLTTGIDLKLASEGQAQTIQASHLLVATGGCQIL